MGKAEAEIFGKGNEALAPERREATAALTRRSKFADRL
jgi:hypothetical protein